MGDVVKVNNVKTAMNRGVGTLALNIEEKRQQRAGLFLKDVAYRLHGHMELVSDEAKSNPQKILRNV